MHTESLLLLSASTRLFLPSDGRSCFLAENSSLAAEPVREGTKKVVTEQTRAVDPDSVNL
jgi:hypothetical protein